MSKSGKSLNARGHALSDNAYQLKVLSSHEAATAHLPSFESKLEPIGLFPLKPNKIEIFQINMGKMCNQTCHHCHVDAGPDRKEIMSRATLEQCLEILAASDIPIVDLTGGAPEMNPNFRWFVEQATQLGKHVLVRCNLTIILANKKYHDLPDFYKEHKVEVVSSLPFYSARRTDSQRGEGVFEKSIRALQMLNERGYGQDDPDLQLNLVYNPSGAFLPASQAMLESQFKEQLTRRHNITFNKLFVITNIPISRFLEYLMESGNYTDYMESLVNAFNPAAAAGVMCRNTLSVGWDGYLYDCDFNQMLDLKISPEYGSHINDFDIQKLAQREIILNNHCYGCTAGAGSSCGGELA